jgi:hypothetical protein
LFLKRNNRYEKIAHSYFSVFSARHDALDLLRDGRGRDDDHNNNT